VTSALIVGAPGSGRTTFVGLLYTASVRFGTEEADRFRFSAERESIRRLESIYGALGSGRFPEGDVDREAEPLRFVFAFRRGAVGRWLNHEDPTGEFDTVPVHVAGMPAEEIAELDEHTPVLDEETRRVLRSPVVIALVNAARLPPEPGGIDGLVTARYDQVLARTLETVARFLSSERNRRSRRLFPVFVLTQLDRMPEVTRRALRVPEGEPSGWAPETRATLGQRILDTHLPETSRFVHPGLHGRVTVTAAPWYFSELSTQDDGVYGVRIRRRSRIPAGGWEPQYPYEEYRSLLLELGHRARLAPSVAVA